MRILLPILIMLPLLSAAESGKTSGTNGDPESSRISLYIPGFIMKAGSWLTSKEKNAQTKYTLKKIRSISLVVREGEAYDAYRSSKKYDKKMNRLQQQHFESLLEVKDDDTKASIFIRQNKSQKIRQLVLIANDGDDSFVFARVRCNFSINDVKNLLQDKNVKCKFSDVIGNSSVPCL